MGGLANVQSFYKLYLVPGIGHASRRMAQQIQRPTHQRFRPHQFYELMVNWVENGVAPSDRIDIQSPPQLRIRESPDLSLSEETDLQERRSERDDKLHLLLAGLTRYASPWRSLPGPAGCPKHSSTACLAHPGTGIFR